MIGKDVSEIINVGGHISLQKMNAYLITIATPVYCDSLMSDFISNV